MKSYAYLAKIYDEFMSTYDYKHVVDRIQPYLEKSKVVKILDLACGTGNASIELYDRGYHVTGIDISEEMLLIANEKCLETHSKIRFMKSDMRDFAVKDRFDAIVSLTDGFNYLINEEDMRMTLRNISNHLKPGGLLIFDMSTAYKFENIIGNDTFAESSEHAAYIWENFYDKEHMKLEFDVTVFLEDERTGLFERHMEEHAQKAYSVKMIEA
jgi:SAM-dependent methyltransferase